MFDLLIKNDDGDVLADARTEAIAIVYESSQGCIASTMMETDSMTAFDMVLSLDMLRDSILKRDKQLKKMYKKRKKIVKDVTQVDLTALKTLLLNMEDDDDYDE